MVMIVRVVVSVVGGCDAGGEALLVLVLLLMLLLLLVVVVVVVVVVAAVVVSAPPPHTHTHMHTHAHTPATVPPNEGTHLSFSLQRASPCPTPRDSKEVRCQHTLAAPQS
jgi:hypothetical protein